MRRTKVLWGLLWFLLCGNAAVVALVYALSPHKGSYACSGTIGCVIAARDLSSFGYFVYASVLLSIGIYGLVSACLDNPK